MRVNMWRYLYNSLNMLGYPANKSGGHNSAYATQDGTQRV